MKEIIGIVAAFFGTLGFTVVFRSKRKHIFVIAAGGALSWTVYLLSAIFFNSEPLCYFIASASVGVYSEIFARVLRTPTTNVFAVAVLPLIPGGGLYYTMRYAVNNEWDMFLTKGSTTIKIALAIALGIISVSTVVKLAKSSALYRKISDARIANEHRGHK